MSKTLYIDIDSTIWPAEKEYNKAAQELYGVPFGENWYSETELVAKFGTDYRKIFDRALDPSRIYKRMMYQNCYRVLLHLIPHFKLHFISHNPRPEKMYDRVNKWLRTYFLRDTFDLSIVTADNCKVEQMLRDDNAWGIIEDQPFTLYRAHLCGFHTFAREHPWNVDVVQQFGIMSFKDWNDAEAQIEGVLKGTWAYA